MQREYGRLCGVRDLRRASWARRHDELFIFSGHTHTVATKANKPVWARSVSWRGHGPNVSTSALPISPNSTGSPPGILSLGSGSGLGAQLQVTLDGGGGRVPAPGVVRLPAQCTRCRETT